MRWCKRCFDLSLACLLVVILGPVMLCLCGLLWCKQGRPLFYVSERMKTPTQSFQIWKFRTMTVVDDDAGVSGGDKGPRITPLGKHLRATRLDEFPQLWNILRGDLSFVGPRPPLREYVDRFPEIYDDVLKCKPGVTGLATLRVHQHEEALLARCQTADETDDVYTRICIPRKARLDLVYQRNRSIFFDVALMFQTVKYLAQRLKQSGKSSI